MTAAIGTDRHDSGAMDATASANHLSGGSFCTIELHEWQEFVEHRPDSMVFHDRQWLELLTEQYGYEPTIVAVKRGNQIQAAAPFLATRSLSGRKSLVSLPFTDYIRLLTVDDSAIPVLRDGIRNTLSTRYRSVLLRTDRPTAEVTPENQWVRHELRLEATLDDVVGNFETNAKRNLRTAERNALVFERRHDLEALEQFYRLQTRTRRRLGVPVQPKKFFVRLHRRFLQGSNGYIGLVFSGRHVLAAAVFLIYRGTVTYKYGASEPQATQQRPNDWLYFNAFRTALDEGCSHFDFGISRIGQHGLRRFKRKWGATEFPVCRDHISGTVKPIREETRAMSALRILIQHSPCCVCRLVGEALYRFGG